ncbi:cytochrome b-c1 complex subunit 10 [Amylostereum chailletii]|nr:cytochrome b-c1 complex subunit 10 [Amylostereum chailletii]KAI0313635.1 cytochrome b-c1 complex subunit 10 [Amylostereum chailletii]
MARLAFYPTPATRRVGTFTLDGAKRWAGSLGIWGVGVGTAAVFFLSVTPKVKNTLLLKIPVLSTYYEDTTPASDKPF